MSPLQQILEQAEPHAHLLQFYQADQRVLATNVSHYLWDGLKRGEAVIVIATPEHCQAFEGQLGVLGVNAYRAIADGRAAFLDAKETLACFMVDGQPGWDLFEAVVGRAIAKLRPLPGLGVRAYGEMVGVLWTAGEYEAAIRLEDFWNRFLPKYGLKLFCGYPIDVFGEEFAPDAVQPLLCAHTSLVPGANNGDLEDVLERAMREILGPTDRVGATTRKRTSDFSMASLPSGEAAILSLRKELAGEATGILSRARQYYQTEKRFRALIENSSDGISLVDATGQVLFTSASTLAVLGYPPHDLVGRNAFDLIHPEDIELVSSTIEEVLSKPYCPVHVQARVRCSDGRWSWIECTASNLLAEPDIGAIVLNFRDITKRKEAEEKKQKDAELLARSNAELQAFAYAAAHDLKELLRTVCACTELLMQKAQIGGENAQLAGYIVEGVSRMTNLLDDLLSFTSLSFAEPPRRVELRDAAEAAIKNLEQAIRESGATITVHDLPAGLGNASHLVQVFQNLIANSIKYRSTAPVQVEITAQAHGSEWLVMVKDNGLGIPSQYHDHVFGLFKRLNTRDIPGTGIGLAICKKIVEGLGGRIWVESEYGKGATFCFTVPMVTAEAPATKFVPREG